jgi:hypothetical protein
MDTKNIGKKDPHKEKGDKKYKAVKKQTVSER